MKSYKNILFLSEKYMYYSIIKKYDCKENYYYKETIKRIVYKIFEEYLSYQPYFCLSYGDFEKHILYKIPDVLRYKSFRKFKVNIMIYKTY